MKKSKKLKTKLWHKFYECSCHGEGIMISTEEWNGELDEDIYLAFFQNGFHSKQLDFKGRLRWCWNILKTGLPWIDMVILNKKQAKSLGEDLLKWAKKTPTEFPKECTVTKD